MIWIGLSLALFGAWIFWAFGEPYLELRGHKEGLYLRRWCLFTCPWGRVYLHNLIGPDPDRDPHNHPWNARVLVLRGSYVQYIVTGPNQVRSQHIRWTNTLGAGYHRIISVRPNTWTLTLTGPVVRSWGFLRNTVHIHWKIYIEHYQRQFMAASGLGHEKALRGK